MTFNASDASAIEAAVLAARLYIGRSHTMRLSDERKLLNRMNAKIRAVAKRRKLGEARVFAFVMREARRRGGVAATPGQCI